MSNKKRRDLELFSIDENKINLTHAVKSEICEYENLDDIKIVNYLKGLM